MTASKEQLAGAALMLLVYGPLVAVVVWFSRGEDKKEKGGANVVVVGG